MRRCAYRGCVMARNVCLQIFRRLMPNYTELLPNPTNPLTTICTCCVSSVEVGPVLDSRNIGLGTRSNASSTSIEIRSLPGYLPERVNHRSLEAKAEISTLCETPHVRQTARAQKLRDHVPERKVPSRRGVHCTRISLLFRCPVMDMVA